MIGYMRADDETSVPLRESVNLNVMYSANSFGSRLTNPSKTINKRIGSIINQYFLSKSLIRNEKKHKKIIKRIPYIEPVLISTNKELNIDKHIRYGLSAKERRGSVNLYLRKERA
jgi:hypothetical protein